MTLARRLGQCLLDPHKADVIASYEADESMTDIAGRYGVSITTVSYFLRKIGQPKRSASLAQHIARSTRGPIQIGERFGNLVVIAGPVFPEHVKRRDSYHVCRCVCGNEKPINTASLIAHSRTDWGDHRSCGCMRSKGENNSAYRHGGSFRGKGMSRLYKTWYGMIQRCHYPRSISYPSYGERGIRVCEAWHDFAVFKAWAEANGYEGTLTIDRLDNDRDYEPGNCRWIPRFQQGANRRSNVYVEAFGERKCLAEWARDPRCEAKRPENIRARLRLGWNAEDAITKPPQWTWRSSLDTDR
jgi:hypothetical protein